MTVLPNRPNDGSRHHEPSSVAGEEHLLTPPTLLTLRDLNHASTNKSRGIDDGVASEPTESVTPKDCFFDAKSRPAEVDDFGCYESFEPESNSAQQSAASQLPPPIEQEDREPASPVATPATLDAQPAGRDWMEMAVQHKHVLIVLLLVITAAIWTSRRTPRETASGLELTRQTGEAAGEVDALEDDLNVFANLDAASTEQQESDRNRELDVATLGTVTAAEQSSRYPSNELPPFENDSSVQPVSSRTPNGLELAAPSLEELEATAENVRDSAFTYQELVKVNADGQVIENQVDGATTIQVQFRQSSTPAGVDNWLRYLPAPPASNSSR